MRHALYRMFDADRRLLYIGRTSSWPHRLEQHEAGKVWWADVAHVAIEYHDSYLIDEAERRAIVTERPVYNVEHNDWTHAGISSMERRILDCMPSLPERVYLTSANINLRPIFDSLVSRGFLAFEDTDNTDDGNTRRVFRRAA